MKNINCTKEVEQIFNNLVNTHSDIYDDSYLYGEQLVPAIIRLAVLTITSYTDDIEHTRELAKALSEDIKDNVEMRMLEKMKK